MSEVIASRQHPLLKRLKAVRDRRGDEAREAVFLEGPRLVRDALRSGLKPIEALAGESLGHGPWAALVAELERAGAKVRLAHDALVDDVSPTEHGQGLVALAPRPRFAAEALFVSTPLLVVASAIQDPGNLGGLLRTAEAAGASGAILGLGCADPFGWKALRGSMGSALRLPHLADLPLEQALALLHAHGVRAVATAADATTTHTDADLTGPLAVLVGNEGAGLSREALDAADERVRIPLAGKVESLNAGVAAGVVLFEAARQRAASAGVDDEGHARSRRDVASSTTTASGSPVEE